MNHDCTTQAKASIVAAKIARRLRRQPAVLHHLRRAHKRCNSPEHAYQYGKALMDSGNPREAAEVLAVATASAEPPPEWLYRQALALEQLHDYLNAIELLRRAIDADLSRSEYRYRLGVCLAALHRHAEAFQQFETAIELNPSDSRPARRLHKSLVKEVPLWRRIAVMEKALTTTDAPPVLAVEYARSAYWMGQYQKSARVYSKVMQHIQLNSGDLYRLAVSLEKMGDDPSEWYEDAVARSDSSLVKRLGISALHETEKEPTRALKSYLNSWDISSKSAEMAFRIGVVAERLYRWELSYDWYLKAVEIDPSNAYRQYKAGLAAERIGNYREAVTHYTIAADLEPGKGRYWIYRAGRSLLKDGALVPAYDMLLGSYEDRNGPGHVCGSVLDERHICGNGYSLGEPGLLLRLRIGNRSPHVLYRQGQRQARSASPTKAFWAYSEYLKRVEPRDHATIREIATNFRCVGELESAVKVLVHGRDFIDPDGIDIKHLTKNTNVRRASLYADYCRNLDIVEDTILYESYWGSSLSCHPLAIYRKLSKDARGKNMVHVWVKQDSALVPEDVESNPNVVVVKYGSDRYLKYLATAKLLVNNTSFVPYFTRRPRQRYMNTWHGTPIKTLGRAVEGSLVEHSNITRNLLQATHIIAPNNHTRDVLLRDFDIAGISKAPVKVIGSPRLDSLVSSDLGGVRIRRQLGIDEDDNRRIVLYAPTWRGTNDSRELDIENLRTDLAVLDSLDEFIVLFRGHHLTESQLIGTDLESRVVSRDIDTYLLLQAVDCLVTDYSSLLFDFLVTGRRVVAYVPDESEYQRSRGLYFPPSLVTNATARNREELLSLVSQSPDRETDELYSASATEYCGWEDGHASDRAIDFFFQDEEYDIYADTKPVVGFFASLLPNGITSALRDLINSITENEARVVLFVEGNVDDSSHVDSFVRSLERRVQVITRSGESVFTAAERRAFANLKQSRAFGSKHHQAILKEAFSAELRRLVGDASISSLIQFEGYASYWSALFASASSIGAKSTIYLHNEMENEVAKKYPYLREIFQWLTQYDFVATVSEAVAKANYEYLSGEGYLTPDQNVYWLRNVIDSDRVRRMAVEELPRSWKQEGLLIVAAGRLSIEKNHSLLIEMMPEVLKTSPNAHLVILGDGPLKSTLEARIDILQLSGSVSLLGHVENPYPYISAADVFVLPSLHEGQPVVLYEAIVLGTRFVAAPTPGTIEIAEQFGVGVVKAEPGAFAVAVLDPFFGRVCSSASLATSNDLALERFRVLFS